MPRRRYPVLARLQQHLLESLRKRRLLPKDEAIRAVLAELGEEPPDPSTISNWRTGKHDAPLGLIVALVDDAKDPAAVLDVLAEPRDCHVVSDTSADTDEATLVHGVLDCTGRLGTLADRMRAAVADGSVDDDERDEVHHAARELRRAAARLEQATRSRR